MKKWLWLMMVMLLTTATPQGQTPDVMRLHVIANSNTQQDQDVKLKVRDRIIEYLDDLDGAKNKEEAIDYVSKELKGIEAVAEDELQKNGCSYSVQAMVGRYDFPDKDYAGVTMPAGEYDALRVVLGEGEGDNWWCVVFPPFCFVELLDATDPQDNQKGVEYESFFYNLLSGK